MIHPGLLLSATLCALLAVAQTANGSPDFVVPYPRVPDDKPGADVLTVKANGTAVETCRTQMNVEYAHFAFTGAVKVEITAKDKITSFDVSPHRLAIKAKAEGSTLVFDLTQPCKLHIQINGLSRFFLFADEPEAAPTKPGEGGVRDLTDYGVISSSTKVQTAAIQRAMDDVASKKGTLYLPPGVYRTGELRAKSNLTLYLAPGAVLKGTGNLADHPAGDFGTQFLHLLDCENVRICGRGVIDAQGRALRLSGKNASASRSKLIRSFRARNIVVEDVILRDSGTWGVHLVESDHLRFTGVKLISNTKHDDPDFPWEMNTDGFDPDNSSHVLIERCFVSSNDDSVAVKLRYGKRRDSSDVVFRENVCWSVKSALKIGSEVYDKTLSRVVFENNDVIRADRGIVVYAYDGATVEDVRWQGNRYEFIGGDIKPMHIEIKLNRENGDGQLRRLLVKDETFEREAEKQSRLQGLDADHVLSDVTFENLVVGGKKCLSAADARIEVSRHVRDVRFK